MSGFGHDPDGRDPNGPDLPDELAALGDQLHDALVARAGDDPPAGTAWVTIEAARGRRRFSGVRPIQLLAAAAVVVIVALSALVLFRRDEVGVSDVAASTSVPATTKVIVPDTGVESPGSTTVEAVTDETVTLPSSTSSSSSSSTSTSTTRPSTTTSASTTPPPTVAPTTVPAATFELRGDGVGVAKFGENDEATIAAVTAVLGQPAENNPYSGPGFYSFRTRTVRWSNVTLLFAERNGGKDFAGWTYNASQGNQVFAMPNNLTLGISAMQLRSNGPQPVVAGDLEGSTGLCFTDHGGKLCGALDPPWQKLGTPDSGTVVSYVAGLYTT